MASLISFCHDKKCGISRLPLRKQFTILHLLISSVAACRRNARRTRGITHKWDLLRNFCTVLPNTDCPRFWVLGTFLSSQLAWVSVRIEKSVSRHLWRHLQAAQAEFCLSSWVTSQTVSLPRWSNWGSVKRNFIQHIFIDFKCVNWDHVKSLQKKCLPHIELLAGNWW